MVRVLEEGVQDALVGAAIALPIKFKVPIFCEARVYTYVAIT